ncbi:MAG: potassium-transporting ATPase subunit KdpA, partial [Paracoccaceae bacterium]
MTPYAWLQLLVFAAVLTGLAIPLGRYVATVHSGRARHSLRLLRAVERLFCRAAGVGREEMDWKTYGACLLAFNAVSVLFMYALQRLQGLLPMNAAGLPGVGPDVALNTAVSFATNTNWQAYGGEITMSAFTQMLGLTVQNFLSAATGIAVSLALIRGFAHSRAEGIGNFWVDLVRATLYLLLPLSLLVAVLLVAQGVPQTREPEAIAILREPQIAADGSVVREQRIALGLVASQVAVKQLGTNGGGFYNVNSAHPLENPTPAAGAIELLAILLLPAALCFALG